MFSPSTVEKIGSYVYMLFDPNYRSVPFYIGKGKGNRVFSHAEGDEKAMEEDAIKVADDAEDAESAEAVAIDPKLEEIRKIHARGDKVLCTIVDYGRSDMSALKLESALIELVGRMLPCALTNKVRGHGSAQMMVDAEDLDRQFSVENLETDERVLVIKIEHLWRQLIEEFKSPARVPNNRIYEAVRASWVVSEKRAESAKYVLAVAGGIVRGVYVSENWEPESDGSNRRRFRTDPDGVPQEIRDSFLNTSVAYMSKRGQANPVFYMNC